MGKLKNEKAQTTQGFGGLNNQDWNCMNVKLQKLKFMKSIIVLLFSLFTYELVSADIIVKMKRGGAKGYRYVSEHHDTYNDNHSLKCKDPGLEACKWGSGFIVVNGNTVDLDNFTQPIINYVWDQISSKKNSGHVIREDQVEFFWKIKGVDKITIRIVYP